MWNIFKIKNFTLLELLIVVSIIFILISVLLPTLRSSTETARRISCASHLKQIGSAISMYISDNGDYLPGPCYSTCGEPTPTSNPQLLSRRLTDYLGWKLTLWNCPSNKEAAGYLSSCGGVSLFGYPGTSMPKKISEIQNFSETWAVMDRDGWNSSASGFSNPPPHINVSRNVLYMDFHVRLVKAVQ